jgi:Na+-translocating ferredoxin:NAD+ oxidoreductase subunit B
MLIAVLAVALLALTFGLLLGYAAIHFKVEEDPLAERLNALLPQTQCGQCGYPGCKPYAEALAKGEVSINRCTPGGDEIMVAIAGLMGVDPVPLAAGLVEPKPKGVAQIDEQLCIGCTLCIQACPVDAILGAAKQMHTVIRDECTGCEKCMEPCPVECIHMVPPPVEVRNWTWPYPEAGQAGQIAVPLQKAA